MLKSTEHLGVNSMSRKRKQYSAEFKTKVVLELLAGDQTVAQVASKYDVTAKSLTDWGGDYPFSTGLQETDECLSGRNEKSCLGTQQAVGR